MPRYKLVVEYDGGPFAGWQRQDNGPSVQGASRALLEAKVVHGSYPPGYAPKRPTRVMPPMPHLTPDLAALAEHLK